MRTIVKYGMTTAIGGRKRNDSAQLRTKLRVPRWTREPGDRVGDGERHDERDGPWPRRPTMTLLSSSPRKPRVNRTLT